MKSLLTAAVLLFAAGTVFGADRCPELASLSVDARAGNSITFNAEYSGIVSDREMVRDLSALADRVCALGCCDGTKMPSVKHSDRFTVKRANGKTFASLIRSEQTSATAGLKRPHAPSPILVSMVLKKEGSTRQYVMTFAGRPQDQQGLDSWELVTTRARAETGNSRLEGLWTEFSSGNNIRTYCVAQL